MDRWNTAEISLDVLGDIHEALEQDKEIQPELWGGKPQRSVAEHLESLGLLYNPRQYDDSEWCQKNLSRAALSSQQW